MNKKSGLGKFIFGLGAGVGLGMLFAPKSGEKTRKELKKKYDEFLESLKDIDVNEIKDDFLNKVEDVRNELDDLDKEKILKIAKEKSKDLKKKTDDLVEYAKNKGTPIVQNAADELRKKAVEVTKNVLDKLEKNDSK